VRPTGGQNAPVIRGRGAGKFSEVEPRAEGQSPEVGRAPPKFGTYFNVFLKGGEKKEDIGTVSSTFSTSK